MIRYLTALFLLLMGTSTPFADANVTGHLTGAWIPAAIGPVRDGQIFAFSTAAGPPPHRGRALRTPDGRAVTDKNGKFSLELPAGTYYLSTRKRAAGDTPGPPQNGDLYGMSRDRKGDLVTYTVKSGETTDIGILRSAKVFKSQPVSITTGMTAITGVVKNEAGAPLAGMVVLVYVDPQVKGKPSFVSQETAADGKYVVLVDQEGKYFMTARAVNNSGRPKSGDLYGVYGGNAVQPVTVSEHAVTKGIDIQVGQFVDRRPK